MNKKFKPVIFGLSASFNLAKKVSQKLDLPLGKIKIERFADGEILTKAQNSVRGKDIYVIQSTNSPANENLMELLIFIDSLKRASARSIRLVIPYFGYARQERKASGRQPITAKLVADLLTVAGADRVITFDLHAPQIQGFFNIPVDDLKGAYVLIDQVKNLNLKDVVVASPDYGGLERARDFADKLGENISVAGIDKIRYATNQTKVMNVFGDVQGKNIIIIDDIIDTGNSIIKAAQTFLNNGACTVYAACIHPVLSQEAITRLQQSKIKKIITTDTIEQQRITAASKFIVSSISDFIAEVINAIDNHNSISEIYNKYSKKSKRDY